MTVIAMVISGTLVGFAGAYQVLGQSTGGFGNDFDASIGFNAITVALLGRSRPWGVFWAGILFGVFQNGGYTMQAANGIDINIVSVVQSLIVLFIAAPPLVRTIFRLPAPGRPRRRRSKNEVRSA
jgi:simple sugar transport system permease protein